MSTPPPKVHFHNRNNEHFNGEATVNRSSSIRTILLSDTLNFLCNLLSSLINFRIAYGSIDFSYFVCSLSNGFEYCNDLKKLFGFASCFFTFLSIFCENLRQSLYPNVAPTKVLNIIVLLLNFLDVQCEFSRYLVVW